MRRTSSEKTLALHVTLAPADSSWKDVENGRGGTYQRLVLEHNLSLGSVAKKAEDVEIQFSERSHANGTRRCRAATARADASLRL